MFFLKLLFYYCYCDNSLVSFYTTTIVNTHCTLLYHLSSVFRFHASVHWSIISGVVLTTAFILSDFFPKKINQFRVIFLRMRLWWSGLIKNLLQFELLNSMNKRFKTLPEWRKQNYEQQKQHHGNNTMVFSHYPQTKKWKVRFSS